MNDFELNEPSQCETFCSDPGKVKKIRDKMHELEVMVDIFKAFGDETRFKIIYALQQEELCVCDLSLIVEMPVATVSYHLRFLKSLRLVKHEKRGKMVFYSLDDKHIHQLVTIALEHSQEGRK